MSRDVTTPILLWFRNDLRLTDQAALAAAVASGCPVIPVYVLDDETAGRWKLGGASRWWLHHSLIALAAALSDRGSRLVLRRGRSVDVIPALADETNATAVYAGIPYEPWARRADNALTKSLAERNVAFHRFRTATLLDPDSVRTKSGTPFQIYSPFARAVFAAPPSVPPAPAPSRILAPAYHPSTENLADWRLLPTHPDWAGGIRATWNPGEESALSRLQAFINDTLDNYADDRDRPGLDATSMLSPHLHFGEISAAQVWHAAQDGGAGAGKFLRELLWREFSIHLLWHHPDLPEQPLRREFGKMPWRHDRPGLRAWQHGQTGIPIVDAGMRQLWRIGWMHNRVRLIAASFLVKHLLIPWQTGEAWFWDTLVDADLANNSASWQWVAGCGADAAPYFRIFNPVLQGRKFDPDGAYVRAWVPELARLDPRHIHAPWDAPDTALRAAGVALGRTYPYPILGLAEGRARALAAYARITAGAA